MRTRRWPPRLPAGAAVAAALALAVASPAAALSFNIDFGTTFGTPSSAYGAGAARPGVWNAIDPSDTGPHALVSLAGLLSASVLTISAGEGEFAFDDGSYSGDDQALLADELDILPTGVGSTATVTISGLLGGTYQVYTYARDADTPTSEEVSVDVNGVGAQLVAPTSNTFTGFAVGETHALHSVTVTPGQDLVITVTIVNDPGTDYGMINGLQIVPAPGPAALLGGAALLALRRARRRA